MTSRPPAEVVVGSAGAAARQRRCLSRGSSGTRTAVARRQRKRTAKAVSLQREQRKHTTNIVPYSQERSGNTRTHGKASALTTNAADKTRQGQCLTWDHRDRDRAADSHREVAAVPADGKQRALVGGVSEQVPLLGTDGKAVSTQGKAMDPTRKGSGKDTRKGSESLAAVLLTSSK